MMRNLGEIVKSWVELAKIPSILSGHFSVGSNGVSIKSLWSVIDPSSKMTEKFFRSHVIPLSSLKAAFEATQPPDLDISSQVIALPPSPFDRKHYCLASDGVTQALVVEESSSKSEYLQIWSGETLVKSYDLKEIDLHKTPGVYTKKDPFGTTMAFSPDGHSLAYLAEKKPPKAKPFFTSFGSSASQFSGAKKSSGPPSSVNSEEALDKLANLNLSKPTIFQDPEEATLGQEYNYMANWGEQLSSCSFSCVVVIDLLTDEFRAIRIPEDVFPCDIQWAGNTVIIGRGLDISCDKESWRTGLIYCSNLPSRIFSCSLFEDDHFEYLSSENVSSISPRVKPGGDWVMWEERTLWGPHNKGRRILALNLKAKGEPQVIYELNPPNGIPIYSDFPPKVFTPNGEIFFVVTVNEGRSILLKVTDQLIEEVQVEGVDTILDIDDRFLLVSASSTLEPPFLRLIEIASGRSVRLTPTSSVLPKDVTFKFIPGKTKNTPASLFIAPGMELRTGGLVVWPHGGPHTIFYDTFEREVLFFLSMGLAVLRLNYVGSLGTSTDTTELLTGRIGSVDLVDCQETVVRVLKGHPELIHPDKIVVFGGSHGGFLLTHLIGTYPEFYQAAVTRNPVTDLTVQIGLSDITDWAWTEPGLESGSEGIVPTAVTAENLAKLWNVSGINKVSAVTCPVLVLVGSEDLRVPMYQGIAYYRALKGLGKEAGIKVYPDCHNLGSPKVNLDMLVSSAVWFLRNLQQLQE